MVFDPRVTIVERFFDEAFVHFRGDEMQYLVTRDFRCHAWGALGFPDGARGACQFIAWLGSAFSDSKTRIDEIFAAGDRVVVRYTFDALHTGEILGVPASGKRARATGIFIARMEGSRIAELWREEDQVSLLRQIGALDAAA